MKTSGALAVLLLCACVQVFAAADSLARQPTTITFTPNLPESGNLVLGVYAGGKLAAFGEVLDERTRGALSRSVEAFDFDGEPYTSQLIALTSDGGSRQVLLVGMGELGEPGDDLDWQMLGGSAVQAALATFDEAPAFVFDTSRQYLAQLAFGAKLGSYYFDKYITDDDRQRSEPTLLLVTKEAQQVRETFQSTLDPVANGIWFARDVSNEPANVIHPESFVATWKSHFDDLDNVRIRVLEDKQLKKLNMGAINGVAQGSTRPPRILVVEYMQGSKDAAPVVIVGKGITFDSGGISLKRSNKMWNMKFDMSGAASTMGALYALAAREAKVNVVGIAALAENLPGGSAQRPGDVVTTMSGKTIEIRNTDAEGRLVLADAIHYADVTYDPAVLIDLATLTGAASRALGKTYSALLTRHDDLVADFSAAAEQSGEPVWRMPLDDDHFEAVQSSIADVVNIGSKGPGISTAAAFIGEFVRETTPWIHLDIAGVAYSDEPSPLKGSPGSEGYGIRLLNAYVAKMFEGD